MQYTVSNKSLKRLVSLLKVLNLRIPDMRKSHCFYYIAPGIQDKGRKIIVFDVALEC